MKIDRELNLVIPVETDSGTIHAHSAPLLEETFDYYFMTITRAYTAMIDQGGEWFARMGPLNATRMLKRVAEADNNWTGPQGVENGLLAVIRQRTNILVCEDRQWVLVPLDEAVSRGFLNKREAKEVESAAVFFTVTSASERPAEAEQTLTFVFGLFGGEITSSTATDYRSSLPISTPDAATGETEKPSSIPR